MKSIELGHCCSNCHDAINYSLKELLEPREAALAGKKLSALCDREKITSIHTDGEPFYSHFACDGCGAGDSGIRWKLTGLKERGQ